MIATPPAETPPVAGAVLERLEHRNERLGVTFRFTYAFHAREVRLERDAGGGFERLFPETFSFQPDRHDPAELYLQLDDLWTSPRRLAPAATRREAERLVTRLVFVLPRYLERLLDRLESEGRLGPEALARVHGDVAVMVLLVLRFMSDKQIDVRPELRLATFHLRKLALRALQALVRSRVRPEALARYVVGEAALFDPSEEVSESGLFYALAGSDPEAADRWLLGMGERAFYLWLEDVCLDEDNRAFETEESPFADRETEVAAAVCASGRRRLSRGRDFQPFLRRRGNKDCARVLGKLEAWFLRQYDVYRAACVIQHAANLERGADDAETVLSRHNSRNYLALLLLLASPYVGAVFAYERAPGWFDLICSLEVAAALLTVFWFLLYRFCWQRDLTFFHASVPRIGAGIIVGYMPVFLIDEVWDLVREPWTTLLAVTVLLGFSTLLYLYVEVQRRLGDSGVAFSRARSIFLLGVVEAFGLGLVMTSLFGRFMVERNWAPHLAEAVEGPPLEALRAASPPFLGELPRILGMEPLLAFPTAVMLMTFLSFFIGTFLQLMWEDLPITEPL